MSGDDAARLAGRRVSAFGMGFNYVSAVCGALRADIPWLVLAAGFCIASALAYIFLTDSPRGRV